MRREAELARRVARFCTAELLDVVDPPDGQPFLVTEFIDGPTLADAVATGGSLGPADLERVAVSVAAALSAIHGAGLVHRDLKPGNVLLSSLGPRVIDFGIAHSADSAGTSADTTRQITLTVSNGPGHTTVSNILGRTEQDARSGLESAGLIPVIQVNSGPSTYGPGLVEKVNPPEGTQRPSQTKVTITVVSGQVDVPSVVGHDASSADEMLRALGLAVVFEGDIGPSAKVTAQQPRAGTIPRGNTVTLTLTRAGSAGGDPSAAPVP